MGNIQLQISLDNMVTTNNKPRQAANNSGNDEWYTPPAIIDLVRQAFGGTIDLDPASCDYSQTWIKAKGYYVEPPTTKNTKPTTSYTSTGGIKGKGIDGLSRPWHASSVFMNPPYGRVLKEKFLNYFLDEFAKGHFKEGIILVNTNNCSQWYQTIGQASTMICLKGNPRIAFIDGRTKQPGKQPGAHNTFFYFNKDGNTTQFENVFRSVGLLLKPQ